MLVPSWPLGGGFKDKPSAKLFCFLGTSEASAVSSQLAEVLPETGKDSGKARCRIEAQRDLQGEGLDVSQKKVEAAKNIDRRHWLLRSRWRWRAGEKAAAAARPGNWRYVCTRGASCEPPAPVAALEVEPEFNPFGTLHMYSMV